MPYHTSITYLHYLLVAVNAIIRNMKHSESWNCSPPDTKSLTSHIICFTGFNVRAVEYVDLIVEDCWILDCFEWNKDVHMYNCGIYHMYHMLYKWDWTDWKWKLYWFIYKHLNRLEKTWNNFQMYWIVNRWELLLDGLRELSLEMVIQEFVCVFISSFHTYELNQVSIEKFIDIIVAWPFTACWRTVNCCQHIEDLKLQ